MRAAFTISLIAVLSLVLVLDEPSSVCSAFAAVVPLSKASPMQTATDPAVGDWQGEAGDPAGSGGEPFCAQVFALGNGRYQANLIPAFDQRVPVWAVIYGKLTGQDIAFEGTGQNPPYVDNCITASIANGLFAGTLDGGAPVRFELKKATRLLPTLGAPPPKGAVVLFDGKSLNQWRQAGGNPWLLDIKNALNTGENCVAYLSTNLYSEDARDALLELGSDDGIKVWLNKKEIYAHNISRGVKAGEDKVGVHLQKGWNPLLLKITQGNGDWGAIARLRMPDGSDIKGIRIALEAVDPKRAVLSEASHDYLMDWKLSGPYSQEGKDASALFDIPFPPEDDKGDWKPMPKPDAEDLACHWLPLSNGAMEVHGGGIISNQRFTDQKLHIEFRLPSMPAERGQARANSGVYLQGRYEVQVLDSYGLEGTDDECGAIYKVAAPRVNMCAPPLQWQTYDITFLAPRFDAAGNKTADATMTVLHNGVLIHDAVPIPAPTTACIDTDITEPGGLYLQDHGSPVWYRNIWVLPLDGAPK